MKRSICQNLTSNHLFLNTKILIQFSGMVSVCAGCDSYYPWSAAIVSSISGLVYLIFSHLSVKYKLDDPLDAFAVHAGAGVYFINILLPNFSYECRLSSFFLVTCRYVKKAAKVMFVQNFVCEMLMKLTTGFLFC